MKPKSYIKLIRINNPTGIWLLFLPCLFGIFLSYKYNPDIDLTRLVTLFFTGSVLMRSAGCIINDIFDRKFDAQVKRTKLRPLANKEISLKGALTFLAILLTCSLIVLLQFDQLTILLGFLVFPLILLYPLAKRFSYYPQILLGVVFNFGILMTTTASLNKINLASFLLYLSSIIWTIIYDSFYAFQDIEDDLKIGIKSTAIKFKNNPKKNLFFLTAIQILLLIIVGFVAEMRTAYYLLIFLVFTFNLCQAKSCDFNNQSDCFLKFKFNVYAGLIILAAIILG